MMTIRRIWPTVALAVAVAFAGGCFVNWIIAPIRNALRASAAAATAPSATPHGPSGCRGCYPSPSPPPPTEPEP